MEVWKMKTICIFNWVNLMFHVNFQGWINDGEVPWKDSPDVSRINQDHTSSNLPGPHLFCCGWSSGTTQVNGGSVQSVFGCSGASGWLVAFGSYSFRSSVRIYIYIFFFKQIYFKYDIYIVYIYVLFFVVGDWFRQGLLRLNITPMVEHCWEIS